MWSPGRIFSRLPPTSSSIMPCPRPGRGTHAMLVDYTPPPEGCQSWAAPLTVLSVQVKMGISRASGASNAAPDSGLLLESPHVSAERIAVRRVQGETVSLAQSAVVGTL